MDEETREEPNLLTEEQRKELLVSVVMAGAGEVVKTGAVGAACGGAVGAIGGPVGAAVGAVGGAVVGTVVGTVRVAGAAVTMLAWGRDRHWW